MLTHFFYDITHFDSNFFYTLHHLLFKPGFLSKEYMQGRRVRYLHPIRMYIFTSAIFFLLFFSFFESSSNIRSGMSLPINIQERANYIKKLEGEAIRQPGDSAIRLQLARARDTTKVITYKNLLDVHAATFSSINLSGTHYQSREEYDSLQRLLPQSQRDGWLKRRWIEKEIYINERFRDNPDEAMKEFIESALHRLPYMLLISLPLFALILKLTYIRRKQFYFADHAVFTIHLYVFTFIWLLVVFGVDKLERVTGWDLWFVLLPLFILLFFYLYKGMRRFYQQRRAKTFVKFILVALLSNIMMMILFVLFMLFSAVTF